LLNYILPIKSEEIAKGKQSWIIKGHKTMIMVLHSLVTTSIYSTVLPSFRVNPKEEGCKFLQNVGKCLANHTAQHPENNNIDIYYYMNLKFHSAISLLFEAL
jgi:hypothetical protein